MPNILDYAKKFLPIIDEIYKVSALTEGMDAATQLNFTGVNEVKVLKTDTTGLGDYDRATGYPKGDITAGWETFKLTEERGKEISIDRMDNEEMLGLAFGNVTGKFLRNHVVPELDAFRFAKYASYHGIQSAQAAALTKDTIIPAIDAAVKELDANEVPLAGRCLYINSDLKPVLNAALQRQWGSDTTVNTNLSSYNGMAILYVPKTRFYTSITLASGAIDWGYSKAADGKSINFMIVYPEAILQAKKFALPKIFTPDENQEKDAWKFQFRIYHDAFVYENKAKGIYLHPGIV